MSAEKRPMIYVRRALAVLTAAVLLTLSACGSDGGNAQEIPELLTPVGVNLDTEPVKRGDLSIGVAYEAVVMPTTHEVYFTVDGRIKDIIAYRGKYVEEGEALIELDQTTVLTQIEKLEDELEKLAAEAEYEDRIADLNILYAEIEVQEARDKFGEGSQNWQLKNLELQNLTQKKRQAQETREVTRTKIEKQIEELRTTASEQILYAPCAGHFYLPDSITEGSYISSGKTVAYVVDSSDLKLVVQNEGVSNAALDNGSCYGWINGERWELTYEPLTSEEKSAYVMAKKVAPTYFAIEGNWRDTIEAGMNGAVLGEIRREKDVLYVLAASILSDSDGHFVYVINDESAREKRYVTVGLSNGIQTEIKEGLTEGEMVYVEE